MTHRQQDLSKQKRRRTRFTYGEQAEITCQPNHSLIVDRVLNTFEVFHRTVIKIKESTEHSLKTSNTPPSSPQIKTSRPPPYPNIENRLNEFNSVCRTHEMPVPCSTIKVKNNYRKMRPVSHSSQEDHYCQCLEKYYFLFNFP